MSEQATSRGTRSPDEVDLIEVFVAIVNFFKKNGSYFLVFSVLGLACGGGYFKLKSNVFASKMVAECMSLPDVRVVDLIHVLDNLRDNKDWDQLAKNLNLTPDEASLIKKIDPLSSVTVDKEAKGVDDYLLPTSETSYLFSIVVRVKDNAILPKLQAGIVSYLTNNEYSKLRVNRFIENRTSLIKFIEIEMKKLDSLNELYATQMVDTKSGKSTLTGPGDYKAILVELQEKKLTCQDELKYATPVRIFQAFTAFPNAVEPVILYCLLIGFLSGNGIALLLIFILALRKIYTDNAQKYI